MSDETLRAGLEADAAPFRELPNSEEGWKAEFGADGIVETLDGPVKTGENQHHKFQNNGRHLEFGQIRPTLEQPSLIVETPRPKEGADRQTAKVYIKAFTAPDKTRYFVSVTVLQGNVEVSISSHLKRLGRIGETVRSGKLGYAATAFTNAVTPEQSSYPAAVKQPDGASSASSIAGQKPAQAPTATEFLKGHPVVGVVGERKPMAELKTKGSLNAG
ncbi:PBECR2 nuclease fold domain-containing protein [Methylococcus sp. EFPC2]|uniref:PBECR2 nuclease fold domain-containing protein n=1 Tax=Methylococcus sp. EFPC2 TaxID=2812648 RepID=UPI0019679706|nr:PBECR2 nuclease fold domain-containing protein [Methylococcus sp. EFPC2]QSA97499.1 hypothetical protein JWZ97_01225 [Methylococcus sp. EFPC2]